MGVVYSQLKIFRFTEKVASLPPDQPLTPPLHVRLKPTNRCNHRCRYCAYRQPDLQLGRDMGRDDQLPRDKFLEIARDLVEMGVRAVTFSGGGEPLVHPDLLEAARILADGGVRLAVLTNGARLTGAIAEFLAHRATWLRVSMDGWDDEAYGRYRDTGDGEYSRIMGNLAGFRHLGGACALGVSLIVDAENWPHIPAMLARYKDIGIKSVKVSACVVANEAAANTAYHAPHFQRARELIFKAQADLADKNFEIQDAWHSLDERFDKDHKWCPYAQILTVIGADQAVYPCQDRAYNHEARLGRLEGRSFREYWSQAKAALLSIDPSRDCGHHCVSNNRNRLILEYLALDPEHGVFV